MMQSSISVFLLLLLSSYLAIDNTASAAPVTLDRRGGQTFEGTATWFVPADEGGPTGSCGPEEDNDSLIVALNHKQYGNMDRKSDWCGKKIRVKGDNGSMVVTINDACPGCGDGSLDMTPRVFKAVVGDLDKGVGPITWHEV